MIIVIYTDGHQEWFSTTLWELTYADKLLIIGDKFADHEVIMTDWVRRVSVVNDQDQIDAINAINNSEDSISKNEASALQN